MTIKLTVGLLRKLQIVSPLTGRNYYFEFSDENQTVEVELNDMSDEQINIIDEHIKKLPKTEQSKYSFVLQQINYKREIAKNPNGLKVKNLQALENALIEYIGSTKHKFLFKENNDGAQCPYFVKNIKYFPPEKSRDYYKPAHTDISLYYNKRGKAESKIISFSTEDLNGGDFVKNLLSIRDYCIENDHLFDKFVEQSKKYFTIRTKIGQQYLSTNKVIVLGTNSWYSDTFQNINVDLSEKNKLVVDEIEASAVAHSESNMFWNKNKNMKEDEIVDTDEILSCALPNHPYVLLYDLNKYNDVLVHVDNLEEYVWDEKVIDKLILSDEIKDLLDLLTTSSVDTLDDIISGKSGGIIVMNSGTPGLGKTLSAEVYSETVKRPLYKVQASQLGISIDQLEERLEKVLGRTMKWNAILLIDEADVYVRSRGTDIQQNAIVGVFLRILETFGGCLFLTTNMLKDKTTGKLMIDDAIMSRCTAHIKFELPNKDDRYSIAKVLATQFKCDISDSELKKINEQCFDGFSGRDIKSALKLAKLNSIKRKEKITVAMMERIKKYQYHTSDIES